MFDPSGTTTGTASTSGSTLSVTLLTPATPTAETTLTVSGEGFGTNEALLGFIYKVAAVTATTIDATRPALEPQDFVLAVTLVNTTTLRVTLPSDIVSGDVQVGIQQTANSTGSPSQTVSFVALSNPARLNITPRITRFISGNRVAGNSFVLEGTGLSPTLSQNSVRFLASDGSLLGTTPVASVTFFPGLRTLLGATVPSGITLTVDRLELEVSGLRSETFQ